MKSRTILTGFMLLPLLCAIGLPARAQTSDADFQQTVAAYQQSPSDAGAEKVIRIAATMDQLPPIPEEARRHFVRGTALFKDAKSPDDYKQVTDEFRQATLLAPWWPDARYNFALAWEAAGDYGKAIANVKLYLLFKLPDADVRAAQDRIYGIEAKQEKAAKAKEEENSPQAVAAREQKSFEDLLRKIDGRRYLGYTGDVTGHGVLDVRGKRLVWGWINQAGQYSTSQTYCNYGLGGYVEIQGRVSRCTTEGNGENLERGPYDSTYTISDDGDSIRVLTVRRSNGDTLGGGVVLNWQR
jgi:hypothetical protein